MENFVRKKLPELLKRYRENCGLSQGQIAEALSVDRSTYTYYEIGKTVPSIHTMMQLLRVLKIPYVEFLECVNDGELTNETAGLADFTHTRPPKRKKLTVAEKEKIYELEPDEQQIVIDYRMLPEEDQKAFMQRIAQRLRELA